MKEIKAIIQPSMLSGVLRAIEGLPGEGRLPAVTVSEARTIDLEHGTLERVTQVKLELMVSDYKAEIVRQTIETHARTGHENDGRIFLIPIEHSTDICSGEKQE